MDLFSQRDSGGKERLTAAPQDIVVLDTSAVSILHRHDDERAPQLAERIAGKRAVVSFQTPEEAWYGASKRGWGERRRSDLERRLRQFEVIWPDDELIRICADLRAQRAAAGEELKQADAWIAATALYLECPLATSDSDFDDIPGLEVWKV